MTAFLIWGLRALASSTVLMVLVLAVRAPVRRAIGPRLAYILWALPVVRMTVPALPIGRVAALPFSAEIPERMLILAVGAPGEPDVGDQSAMLTTSAVCLAIWALGAAAVFAIQAVRHFRFCGRLRREGILLGLAGGVHVVEADVVGPVAFGVIRRFVAMPRGSARLYGMRGRDLALAHECAHHARGDLIANWVALVMLAIHWWNPLAWIANAAFREDQEYAADADVIAAAGPSALASYATLLANASGVGAPPACSLNARSNLKGRLMMLDQQRRPLRRVAFSGTLTFLLVGTALAATAVTPVQPGHIAGKQANTIGVKPDGSGAYALIVDGTTVAPGVPLPNGRRLPADFVGAGGCDLSSGAKPIAMAIKGPTPVETYTVMCASAAPADVHATLDEGLASLQTMRTSVATQQATASFPEAERTHALAAIDRSIREVRDTLTELG